MEEVEDNTSSSCHLSSCLTLFLNVDKVEKGTRRKLSHRTDKQTRNM